MSIVSQDDIYENLDGDSSEMDDENQDGDEEYYDSYDKKLFENQKYYELDGDNIHKKYVASFTRSVIEDNFNATGRVEPKLYNAQEAGEDEATYNSRKGPSVNMAMFEGKANEEIIKNFITPAENNSYIKKNYLLFDMIVSKIKRDPKMLEEFYNVEEDRNPDSIEKILTVGHLKDSKYNESSIQYLYNYDNGSQYDKATNVPLDRIRRGALNVRVSTTNMTLMEAAADTPDAILSSGSTLQCSVSGTTSTFTATSLGNWATVNGQSVATIKDDSAVNIGSFGYCPARDKECKFSSAGGWQNTDAMSFGGEDSLTDKSYIQCAHGGTIKVLSSGQDIMKTNTKGSGK